MPPLILALELLIFAVAVTYGFGVFSLWDRLGWGHGLPVWKAACFFAGTAILGLSLAGPMDALADRSFAAHMVQHMLLMKVIPPLLLLGEISPVFLRLIGGDAAHRLASSWSRSRLVRLLWPRLTSPWVAWSFFTLTLWGWHVPALYQSALSNEWLHALEHLMFLGSSLLFWWYILQPRADRAVRYGAILLYLFTTLLHESALGALLTFSSVNWYTLYSLPDPWHLSPLADQQVAGMIMWLPGGILFAILMEVYFGAWLRAIEKRVAARSGFVRAGDGHD